MATIQDIISADSRKGDIASGGGDAGAFQFDSRPVQMFAQYANQYGREMWKQQITDRDTKIEQIAEKNKIDANNLYSKDKNEILKDLSVLEEKAKEYAKNPNITIKDNLEWQTALSGVMNKYKSGAVRAVDYYSELGAISASGESTEDKEAKKRDLEKRFSDTDISTKFPKGTGYKSVAIEIPKPKVRALQNIQKSKDADGIYNLNQSIFVPEDNASLTTQMTSGLMFATKGLGGIDKELQENSKGQAQLWNLMAESYNSVIGAQEKGKPKYFDVGADGKLVFNETKFRSESPKMATDFLDDMQGVTKYSKKKQGEISLGLFNDLNTDLKAPKLETKDFDKGIINITPEGVTPNQMAMVGIWGEYVGDKVTKDYKHTGERVADFNAKTSRMGANTSAARLAWEKAKYDDENKPTDPTKNEFGNLIYGINLPSVTMNVRRQNLLPMNAVSIKDGAIVDKDGKIVEGYSGQINLPRSSINNSIITEFNKSTGNKLVEVDGEGGYKVTETKGEGKIRMNGGVNVTFVNGIVSGIDAQDGTFIDVEQFSNITKNAAQKGTTKYKQADTDYGTQTKTISEDKLAEGARRNKMTLSDYKRSIGL